MEALVVNFRRGEADEVMYRRQGRLCRRFSLFVNITNLFEASSVQYQARPNQPYLVSQTSRRINFGLRGSR